MPSRRSAGINTRYALFAAIFLSLAALGAAGQRVSRVDSGTYSASTVSSTGSASAGLPLRPTPFNGHTVGNFADTLLPLHFLSPVSFDGGGFGTVWVEVADFNGDGKPDVVVSDALCSIECSHSFVSVMIGNGDGTLKPGVAYETGGLWASLAVGDVNGDGKLDVVALNEFCTNSNNSCVGVLLGNGDGTFKPVVTYSTAGFLGRSLALADLNGDGKLDVAVAHFCSVSVSSGDCPADEPGLISVLLGNGDGTFRSPAAYSPGGYGTSSVAVVDVNSDGKPDLLVANQCAQICEFYGEGGIGVLLNNGDGTFQTVTSYDPGGENTNVVISADLNADKKLDLIVSNTSGVGVLLGNGDGTFNPAHIYQTAGGVSLAVADMNQDGQLDVLAGSGLAVDVLLGNGDGSLQNPEVYAVGGGGSVYVTSGDLNGDGWLDIVASSSFANGYGGGDGLVSVLLNNSTSTFVPTQTLLYSSLNPSAVGQGVTFSATVTSSTGTPPNGTPVTFYLYGTPEILGTALLSNGSAAITTSVLPVGTSPITAVYTGTGRYGLSMSAELQQVVKASTKSVTSTSLKSSLNPGVYGQKVTWTATTTTTGSFTPTGKVNFNYNNFTLGTASLNSSGVATLSRSNTNTGTYPLIAAYVGDANNLGSSSPILNQVITQATSTTTLSSSPDPSTKGQAVIFTAKVTSPTTTPTGPVTFTAGSATLGTANLSNGKAVFTTSTLAVGSITVTATYATNSDIAGSSASVTQTVQP